METLEILTERITELTKDVKSLAKSYKILNDNHHKLELGYTELRTEWETNKSWIKWILGSSLIGTLVGIVSLLKTLNVI